MYLIKKQNQINEIKKLRKIIRNEILKENNREQKLSHEGDLDRHAEGVFHQIEKNIIRYISGLINDPNTPDDIFENLTIHLVNSIASEYITPIKDAADAINKKIKAGIEFGSLSHRRAKQSIINLKDAITKVSTMHTDLSLKPENLNDGMRFVNTWLDEFYAKGDYKTIKILCFYLLKYSEEYIKTIETEASELLS